MAKIARGIIALAIASLFLSSRVWAQPQVERATKEVTRDVRQKAEERLISPPRKPAKPGEEAKEKKLTGPKTFIKKLNLEGTESLPVEDFKAILEKYENREVYESELKEDLVREIQGRYLKTGLIAAAYIPPQEIKDGVMTIKVIEAKMGDLEVTKHRYFLKDRLRYYWPIKSGETLRYDKMSRALQFMNKNPDREVKATLLRGKRAGTTDVQLATKTFFPLHATAMLDNEGSVPTGKIRKGLGFVENNLLGLDDRFIAGYTGGKNFGGVYAYHAIPITYFGTTLMYGYSKTKAFPKKDFEQYGLSSVGETISAFIYQDLYHKDTYKGDISLGIEAKNKRVVDNDGTINSDRLRIVRLGSTLIGQDVNNIVTFKPQFSQGLNFLGARRKSEYSSRQASNTFSKFNLTSEFIHRFPGNIKAHIKLDSQIASEKLMPQEELFMGGIDSIRGYPSGDYLADTGFCLNNEILVPAFFLPDWLKMPCEDRPMKDNITGLLFFDIGYGEKRGSIEGEQSKRKMASLGAGIRIRVLDQITLRLEWGFPLDMMANMPITEFDRSRLHFSIDFEDKLPKMIEKCQKTFKKKYIAHAKDPQQTK